MSAFSAIVAEYFFFAVAATSLYLARLGGLIVARSPRIAPAFAALPPSLAVGRELLLHSRHFRHPWRSAANCSCCCGTPAVPGGRRAVLLAVAITLLRLRLGRRRRHVASESFEQSTQILETARAVTDLDEIAAPTPPARPLRMPSRCRVIARSGVPTPSSRAT